MIIPNPCGALLRVMSGLFLLPALMLAGGAHAASPALSDADGLRVLVVKIVDQGGFLSWLLEDAVQQGFVARFHADTTHVRDIRERLHAQHYDLVIAHAHAKPARRLEADGTLTDGRIVFANARAIIGPAADPAGVGEAAGFTAATARIADTGACWLVNHHAGLSELQQRILTGTARPACVIDDSGDSGPGAIVAARTRAAYTVWGYHPFMRMQLDGMRAFAFGDRFLLRPLKIWRVADGAAAAAPRMIEALLAPEVQRRIADFRLPQDPLNQAWWPAGAAQSGSRPGGRAGSGSGAGRLDALPQQGANDSAGGAEAEMREHGKSDPVTE